MMKVGILGPENTSTDLAYKSYLMNNPKIDVSEIIYLDTFEDVFEKILKRTINIAIVPSAYTKINKFFMSRELDLLDFIKLDTLDYHALIKVNSIDELLSKQTLKVGLKEETLELIADFFQNKMFNGIHVEYVNCNSTQNALLKMKQGTVDIAISNSAGLNNEIISLKNFGCIQMTWNIFINNSRN